MASHWYAVVLVIVTQLILDLHVHCQTVGVAPNDRNAICRTDHRYRVAHDWIPYANSTSNGTWKVLIDQYDYENLIGATSIPPGVWNTLNSDNDRLFLAQGTGGTCTFQIRVPDTYRRANQNNWIFTQAIDYIDAVELIVNATIRLVACAQRSECVNDYLILYRYDTNTLSETNRNEPTNYRYYSGDSQSSRLQQVGSQADTTIVTRFRRPANFNYTYLGIQDIGSAGSIVRIFLYYEVCPGKVVGLVTYPEVPHPGELQGSLPHTMRLASCADHAHNTTNLETYAYHDRRCEQNVVCVCDVGYEQQQGQNSLQCVACRSGQYRSALNNSCVQCPANSESASASENCTCTQRYYRANASEGVGLGCTAPPDPINECSVSRLFDTAVTIQWTNPARCGGRSDCFYEIKVNDGSPIAHTPDSFRPSAQEIFTVDNLQPDTTYSINVSIHNGVSDQDSENARVRECPIIAKTIQGSAFMLGDVTYLNNTAVLLEDIGGDNPLICTTAFAGCCIDNPGQGTGFYYPNGDPVSQASPSKSLYMTRNDHSISLNQQIGESLPPLGRYRCEIPDGRGTPQDLYIRIGTAISPELNTTAPTTLSIVAVVYNFIAINIPGALVSMIAAVEVQIRQAQTAADSGTGTTEVIIFRESISSGGEQLTLTIPSDQVSKMEKGSTYFIIIRPVYINGSEGTYGLPYIFEFSGAAGDSLLAMGSYIPLIIAVVVTFAATAIVISLLWLSIVACCMTCKKKNGKIYSGTSNPAYGMQNFDNKTRL